MTRLRIMLALMVLLNVSCAANHHAASTKHIKVVPSVEDKITLAITVPVAERADPVFLEGKKDLFPNRFVALSEAVIQATFGLEPVDFGESEAPVTRQDTLYHFLAHVRFPSGKAKLKKSDEEAFLRIANALQVDEKRTIMIVGHSDSSGNKVSNRRLSVKRAYTVAKLFVQSGFPPSHVFYQGVGEYFPLMSNATKDGRLANRRIEILEGYDFVHVAKKRLAVIGKALGRQQIFSPIMMVKSMQKELYALALTDHSFSWKRGGKSFHGHNLMKYGESSYQKKKENIFVSSFNTFFGGASGQPSAGESRLLMPNILEESFGKESGRKSKSDLVSDMDDEDYKLGYKTLPMFIPLQHAQFMVLDYISILESENKLIAEAPRIAFYKNAKTKRPSLTLSGSDHMYVDGQKMLYRWKSSRKNLLRTGFIGFDVMIKDFSEEDFKRTHVEFLTSQMYFVSNGKILVAKVMMNNRLLKKKDASISWRKIVFPTM